MEKMGTVGITDLSLSLGQRPNLTGSAGLDHPRSIVLLAHITSPLSLPSHARCPTSVASSYSYRLDLSRYYTQGPLLNPLKSILH